MIVETPTAIKCLICQEEEIEVFLDLGNQPLANKFIRVDEFSAEEKYPLKVGACLNCGHIQLMNRIPPSLMFENYLYLSSMSETLKSHMKQLAREVVHRFSLGPNDLVVDIGSNDGTLLSAFEMLGTKTLGIDPAKNLAQVAKAAGVETFTGFFDLETVSSILSRYGKASVITITNTFPHIHNLPEFAMGVDKLLKEDGVLVIEAHYLIDMLEQTAFDTIYHEHVSYWALHPLQAFFTSFGFEVIRVERLALHHGQLRLFIKRKSEGQRANGTVHDVLALEKKKKIQSLKTLQKFAQRAALIKISLNETLQKLAAQRKRIVGYGAPAKGNTLLNFAGIDSSMIQYILDRNPLKQGLFTPGSHIPVTSPSRLTEDLPDYTLLLAWNFADEIMEQQSEYLQRGGRFIIPIPAIKII